MIDIRKSWDKIALRYVKRYGISTNVVHYGPLCPGEDRLGLLGNIRGQRVLDLGCGCGQNAIALARLGANVYGVDLSDGQLMQAKILAKEADYNINFIQSDMANLGSFADKLFDLVISACAISFVKDIDKTFKEVYRILKPNGNFMLSDMHPLQYILDGNGDGVTFNNQYPFSPILMKWRWDFAGEKEGKVKPLSAGFQHYVRSLPFYHNALVDAGFLVREILEPEPTLDTPHYDFSHEIWSEYHYIATHLPITFIMKCQKA